MKNFEYKIVQLDIPKMTEQQWHDLLNACTEFMRESVPSSFEHQSC